MRKDLNLYFEVLVANRTFRLIIKSFIFFMLPFGYIGRQLRGWRLPEFEYIELVVSTRCTLNCRYCANLMQYNSVPKDFPVENLICDFRAFISKVSYVKQFRILGGEPLLYTDLDIILQEILISSKVGSVQIVTNGTLPLPSKLIPVLQNKKVSIAISNYLPLSHNLNQILDCCKEHGICVYVVPVCWNDMNYSNSKGRTKEELIRVFSRCDNKRCKTILNGELHHCPVSANGMLCGLIPRNKDFFVDLHTDSLKIKDFLNQKYVSACDFCDGCYAESHIIPTAEQLPHNDYLKFGSNAIFRR